LAGETEQEHRSPGPRVVLSIEPGARSLSGWLGYITRAVAAHGYYECAVVIADSQLRPLPHTDAQTCDLRCAVRASRRLATWRKSSLDGHEPQHAIPGFDNGGYFHAMRKLLIAGGKDLCSRMNFGLVRLLERKLS